MATGYTYQKLDFPEEEVELQETSPKAMEHTIKKWPKPNPNPNATSYWVQLSRTSRSTMAVVATMFVFLIALAAISLVRSADNDTRTTLTSSLTDDVPQYFQTTPELYPGIPWP